jgi:hypothetical protein
MEYYRLDSDFDFGGFDSDFDLGYFDSDFALIFVFFELEFLLDRKLI